MTRKNWRTRFWKLPFMPVVPYPLRAASLSLTINIFGCWWKPSFVYRGWLSEKSRADGNTIWWARWLWFQISYKRFM